MTEPLEPLVTREMADAGLDVYEQLVESFPAYLLVVKIYEAMAAASATVSQSVRSDGE